MLCWSFQVCNISPNVHSLKGSGTSTSHHTCASTVVLRRRIQCIDTRINLKTESITESKNPHYQTQNQPIIPKDDIGTISRRPQTTRAPGASPRLQSDSGRRPPV